MLGCVRGRTLCQLCLHGCNVNQEHFMERHKFLAAAALAAVLGLSGGAAKAQQPAPASPPSRPNILVIFGDDIGQSNISAYTQGLVGYRTPNIDRIAKEGMMFTDYYAETAARRDALPLSRGRRPSAPASPRSAFPARRSACRTATSRLPRRSRPAATRPGSSARTISVTAMNTCRPGTASTSSSATSIISMPKRSPSGHTGPSRTRPMSRPTRRAACSRPRPTARSRIPAR